MTRNWLSIIVLLFTASGLGSECIYAAIVDPTKPPNFSVAAHDNTFVLTAILIAPNHRMAVINGKILHVGDLINGAKVIDIKETNVDIEGPHGKASLVMADYSLAKPVKNAK
jgi:hypothetical protein